MHCTSQKGRQQADGAPGCLLTSDCMLVGIGQSSAQGEASPEGTNLTGPDTAFQVEGAGDCMPRELLCWDVGQKSGGIDIDGMAARGPQDRDAGCHQALPQKACGGHAILQVALQRQQGRQALPTIRAHSGGGAAERARQAALAGNFKLGCNC